MKSKSIINIENIWNGRKKYYSNHGEDLWEKNRNGCLLKELLWCFQNSKKFDLHVPILKKTTHNTPHNQTTKHIINKKKPNFHW